MTGQVKKYQQVVDWIMTEIENGNLKKGERLMPENLIASKFDMSRQTIRRAMQELVDMGVLSRIQGSGTYVGSKKITARKSHMNIAVVSTFYDSYIFPSILRGIEKCLSKNDYTMQIAFTDNKIENERRILLDLLKKDSIDGLIIEPSESAISKANIDLYEKFSDMQIPVIFFNDRYETYDAPCVRMNDYKVAKEATTSLLQLGHRKIAGIFKSDDGQGSRRYQGYVEGLKSYDIRLSRKNVLWIDSLLLKDMKDAEDYIFKRIEGCTAVMCYNDEVALQIIDMAEARGIKVPDDMSVISIDDSNLAGICKVPITSYEHPKEKLGEKAASNLISMIRNSLYDGNYLFDSDVVWRDSVKKINDSI